MDSSGTESPAGKERAEPTLSTPEKPTISLPSSYVADNQKVDESSKLKTLLSILRRFIGVSDIASVRFSLPAQLLEPIPNLEYWNYLDRPETFISIGDSEDALGRMLAVLRFWFTKDLVEILRGPEKAATNAFHAEICQGEALQAIQFNPRRILSSMSSYPRSGKNGIDFASCNWEVEDKNPTLLGEGHKTSARISSDSKQEVDTTGRPIRVSYITEQTSHHPPVSAFWVDCPVKGISARGFDQLSAKFTGTSVRVTPGAHNLGIFIELAKRDNEEYQLTHPTAHLGGLIRGSLAVTVADTCFVTCPKTRMKTILQYLEEGWLGKTQHKVNGVVYRYDPENDKCTRIKDVSEKDVIARIEGCWHDQIYYTRPGSKDSNLLIDLKPLWPAPKIAPPEDQQLPNESRRFWHGVTAAILSKQYAQATKVKQELEERQREKATQREKEGKGWRPRFFKDPVTTDGRPELTEEGKAALRGLQAQEWHLSESEETGA